MLETCLFGQSRSGANRSRVTIDGQTTTTVPNVGSNTVTGNLLAQSTNIGRFERDQFMAIPDLPSGLSAGSRRRSNYMQRTT